MTAFNSGNIYSNVALMLIFHKKYRTAAAMHRSNITCHYAFFFTISKVQVISSKTMIA